MTSLAQAETTLMEQSLKVRELGDNNETLKRQLTQAEDKVKELLDAKSHLETQLRSIQQGDNEAALLISKLERDFATAASTIRQLQRDKEVLTRNYEGQLSTLKEELKTRERELAAAEQALVSASDFRREVAESTDEHVQEVVNTNDILMEQLQEKEKELEDAHRQCEALAERLKKSDARAAELEEHSLSVSRFPVLLSPSPPRREFQQRSLLSYVESDSEPVRLPSPDEDQIREQLLTLKQERVAIREEIESRMKRVDGRQRAPVASRTVSDSGLLDISSRMASLEARLARC